MQTTQSRIAFLSNRRWWRAFLPARTSINTRERIRIGIGCLFGLLLTAVASHWAGGLVNSPSPWLLAPMGASAVLVFAVPASPMAQPWAVIGGNTLCALAGIAGVHGMHILGSPELAAALAVATAIMLMLALRCLHPPGGATALLLLLGGVGNFSFAIYPVMANALLLVVAGVLYNNLTRRVYPHTQLAPAQNSKLPSEADLDAVLAAYNQVLDVSRDDLQALVGEMRNRAYERQLTGVRCADIMSRELITMEFGSPLQDAWTLLHERRIKALPVVDRYQRLVGIVTLADFMRAAEVDAHSGIQQKLKRLVAGTPGMYSSKPEVIGQIMSRQVRVTRMDRNLADLLPLFSSTGHHHIPVIGDDERLVGMITQSDLIRALAAAANPAGLEGKAPL